MPPRQAADQQQGAPRESERAARRRAEAAGRPRRRHRAGLDRRGREHPRGRRGHPLGRRRFVDRGGRLCGHVVANARTRVVSGVYGPSTLGRHRRPAPRRAARRSARAGSRRRVWSRSRPARRCQAAHGLSWPERRSCAERVGECERRAAPSPSAAQSAGVTSRDTRSRQPARPARGRGPPARAALVAVGGPDPGPVDRAGRRVGARGEARTAGPGRQVRGRDRSPWAG